MGKELLCKKCMNHTFKIKEYSKKGRYPHYYICEKCGEPHEVGDVI